MRLVIGDKDSGVFQLRGRKRWLRVEKDRFGSGHSLSQVRPGRHLVEEEPARIFIGPRVREPRAFGVGITARHVSPEEAAELGREMEERGES